ncbi:hypothetical protein [Desulfogranum marinum]|uniref:hypothetical protein n=1 Tax=Desulfogranum marinum TaxID=453220 RepID=UPI0029C6651F|nr:hypothetical protein [Desulfogranum marinum]
MQTDTRQHFLGSRKKNAPSFIYEILHGKEKFLFGKGTPHRQKDWGGIPVDANIPTAALNEINSIQEIEIRSSCEGVDIWKPTFLIFRFRTAWDQEKIDAFVAGMNAFPDISCGAGIGNGGMYRVGITTALWYQKDRNLFTQWWLELPQKMQTVLTVIHCLSS